MHICIFVVLKICTKQFYMKQNKTETDMDSIIFFSRIWSQRYHLSPRLPSSCWPIKSNLLSPQYWSSIPIAAFQVFRSLLPNLPYTVLYMSSLDLWIVKTNMICAWYGFFMTFYEIRSHWAKTHLTLPKRFSNVEYKVLLNVIYLRKHSTVMT